VFAAADSCAQCVDLLGCFAQSMGSHSGHPDEVFLRCIAVCWFGSDEWSWGSASCCSLGHCGSTPCCCGRTDSRLVNTSST
jgi:hypothetical protein